MKKQTRLNKLIDPHFQLKLASYFTGLAVLAMLFQFVLFAGMMSDTAAEFTEVSSTLYEEFRNGLLRSLLYSAFVILPLTLIVGILVSYRVAGPIYRFRKFLESVAAGERPAECKLRKGDELQDLCKLLNEATAPLRDASGADEQGLPSAAA